MAGKIEDIIHCIGCMQGCIGDITLHHITEINEATIKKENPDAVIVATGATPFAPNIPAINS
ncbi:NAD(P)/FAD-dependent oxidoreductase [Paenibacillus antibioticophila]|uniref:NAD(P)/FAD-dependent oxidoreductase n=1 Tax=Paenibacillus antibioticophila TaxID=1274374 RepID=UPI001F3373F9|nr:NAD(P)/FAD-dependent oxidoreductase [Paenibacillus antibioticophila]